MQRILDLICSDIIISLNFYKQGNARVKIVCQLNPDLALVDTKSIVIRNTATVNETLAAIQKVIKGEIDHYRNVLAADQADLDRRAKILRKFDSIVQEESEKPEAPKSRRKLQVKQEEAQVPADPYEGWTEDLEDLI